MRKKFVKLYESFWRKYLVWSLIFFFPHKETFLKKDGNLFKLFSVINQEWILPTLVKIRKIWPSKVLKWYTTHCKWILFTCHKISSIYIFQSIYSSQVCKIYVQVVLGLEHLKSFNHLKMKSKVILIFGLFAVSQGAVPRDRFAICTFFPEQCLSTKPSEGTSFYSNSKDSV